MYSLLTYLFDVQLVIVIIDISLSVSVVVFHIGIIHLYALTQR